MTVTSKKEMGNHLRASLVSKSRYEMTCSPTRHQPKFSEGGFAEREERTRMDLHVATQATQTPDWIVKRRKFMVNCLPETTNWGSEVRHVWRSQKKSRGRTLFTTVMRMLATQ